MTEWLIFPWGKTCTPEAGCSPVHHCRTSGCPQDETSCPPTVDRNTRSSAAFPIIDISEKGAVVEIDAALRSWGGFVCTGHSIDPELLLAMQEVSRKFFALPQDLKDAVHLRHAGAQWRGYMPMGGERSEGGTLMDHKEGLYCGDEHDPNEPRCLAKLPTWGQNLLPDEALPSMRGVLPLRSTPFRRSLLTGRAVKEVSPDVVERSHGVARLTGCCAVQQRAERAVAHDQGDALNG